MAKITLEFETSEVDDIIEKLQKLASVQTVDQMREAARKEVAEKISDLSSKVDAFNDQASKKEQKKFGKRWSRKYDDCIRCHRTDSRHATGGGMRPMQSARTVS